MLLLASWCCGTFPFVPVCCWPGCRDSPWTAAGCIPTSQSPRSRTAAPRAWEFVRRTCARKFSTSRHAARAATRWGIETLDPSAGWCSRTFCLGAKKRTNGRKFTLWWIISKFLINYLHRRYAIFQLSRWRQYSQHFIALPNRQGMSSLICHYLHVLETGLQCYSEFVHPTGSTNTGGRAGKVDLDETGLGSVFGLQQCRRRKTAGTSTSQSAAHISSLQTSSCLRFRHSRTRHLASKRWLTAHMRKGENRFCAA